MIKTSVLKIRLEIYKCPLLVTDLSCTNKPSTPAIISQINYTPPVVKKEDTSFPSNFHKKFNVTTLAKNLTKWPKSLRLNIKDLRKTPLTCHSEEVKRPKNLLKDQILRFAQN
ncbi:MAG TPA: hypothetical protein ACFYED_05540, partial [Candidatus Tripitaka californicus]|uniref:hypothetical protein n=1 Tax=Candidatus Tripitaka californicus TaxID=3367616 RepID=UPI00402575F0